MHLTSPLGVALLVLGFTGYWLLAGKPRLQNVWLIMASMLCYGYINPIYPVVLLVVSGFAFGTAKAISRTDNEQQRSGLLAMGITFVGGSLLSLKYAHKSWSWMGDLVPVHSASGFSIVNWVAPIGLSFYVLGLIGYLVDVKRYKAKAETDPLLFIASVSFLPHLLSGPIPKHSEMLPQLRSGRRLDVATVLPAAQLIIWGLFKKLVIADNLAPAVNYCFGRYGELSGSALLLGVVFASVQIYADFSGYSDMAFGIARLLGINIDRNFNRPLFSRNPAQYWRNWHMSLNRWLREYLYLPLGGRTTSTTTWIVVVIAVFAFSGAWHGTGFNFILWGLSNAAIYLVFHYGKRFFTKSAPTKGVSAIPVRFSAWVVTFYSIALTRVFFRAPNMEVALGYYKRLFQLDLFTAAPEFLARYAIWCLPLFVVEALTFLQPKAAQRDVLVPARIISVLFCVAAITGIYFFQYQQDTLEYIYFRF
jgi:D-alanyl-lipoteichoic acid acyltransferase DltB (MBOAT superfamily)